MNYTTREFQIQNQIFNSRNILSSQLRKLDKRYNKEEEDASYLMNQIINEQKMMINKIYELKITCEQIKRSFELNSLKSCKKIEGTAQQEIPPLIIKSIKKLEREDELQCVRVANKLKILVSKVCHQRNSAIRYDFNNYVDRMLSDLKQQKSKKLFINDRNKTRNDILLEIKKKFKILTLKQVQLYRRHVPFEEFFIQKPVFCVNFYNQRLLFFRQEPLPWNSSLFFCPIIFNDQFIDRSRGQLLYIPQTYMQQLYKENHYWQDYTLTLIIKQKAKKTLTSEIPQKIYYSKCSVQKLGNKLNQKPIISQLRKIRGFLYANMVMKWLIHVIKPRQQNGLSPQQIQINLCRQWKVILTTAALPVNTYSPKSSVIIQKPSLISNFMNYFSEQKLKIRNERSDQEVTNNLNSFLRILKQGLNLQQKVGSVKIEDGEGSKQEQSNHKTSDYSFPGPIKYWYAGNRRVKL